MSAVSKGHCLCGTVQLEGRGASWIDVCHCDMCQHWHGGPGMAVYFEDGVTVTAGTDQITAYESSDWARRSFCSTCGSTLYFTMKGAATQHFAQAGLFDLPDGTQITEHIFVDEKPPYYDFSVSAPVRRGAESREKYAEQLAKYTGQSNE